MGTLGCGGEGASLFGQYSGRERKQTRYKGEGVEIHRYKEGRRKKEKGRGLWRKIWGILVGGGWEIDKGGHLQEQAETGEGKPGRGAEGGAERRGRKAALRKGRHAAGTRVRSQEEWGSSE